MSTPSIKQLRQSGWKIRVMHKRNYDTVDKIDGRYPIISNFGGETKIEVTSPEGLNATGIAICSLEENFNRRVGNSIALGRALQNLHKINN
jgi:hypothetical protein